MRTTTSGSSSSRTRMQYSPTAPNSPPSTASTPRPHGSPLRRCESRMTDIVARTPFMRALLAPTCQQQRPAILDCALHDMRRDRASVQCYRMPPAIRKEVRSDERVPRECGPGLWEEMSGITTKNQNDRHRGHLKRGTAPLISLFGGDVGSSWARHPNQINAPYPGPLQPPRSFQGMCVRGVRSLRPAILPALPREQGE